jgi:hypothetical protein
MKLMGTVCVLLFGSVVALAGQAQPRLQNPRQALI